MGRSYRIMRSAAACLAILGSAFAARAADPAHPAVVELFTSQGCSSCPPANDNLAALADRPGVLALSFGVTYWDKLGWKDTFARPEFTARQWDYAHRLGHRQVWSPQMLINGRTDVVGAARAEIDQALTRADRGSSGPELKLVRGRITVGAGSAPKGGADIWLVRYDPRIVRVPVRRGENAGVTLPHRDVVRVLVRVGRWTGPPVQLKAPPPSTRDLVDAVLVQAGPGGPIIAAAKG